MKNYAHKKLEKTISQANHFFVNQRYHQALPLYQQAIKIAPKDHHIWSNLASTLMQLGQLEEAKNHFEIALNLYPKNPAALNNLAALLGRLGKKKEALETLENLHQLTPNDHEVLSNIGVALNRLDRQQEALLWFDKALALAPTFSDAHHGKASAAAHLGQEKTAQFHCQQAIQYKSHAPSPRLLNMMLSLPVVAVNKQQAQQTVETFTQNIFSLKNWVEQDSFYLEELGNIVGDRQPFALAYRLGNICEPLSLYGDIIARAAKAYWEKRNLFPIPKPEKREKIRLAILSEQIRRHSVWDIILKGIVKHLNRQYFEIFLYHTGMHIDEETKWAESVVDKFIQGPKGHTEWLIQIRQDTPDVIFFPEIGMDTLTCKLAALRLAPLQVASWGHPVTTGLPEIDLYFSGELIEGEQAATHYREKLIKLPGTGACTEPLPNPALPIPREQLSIPEDRTWVRMVICQRPFKLDPAFDDMLAQTVKASWPCKLFILKDMQLPWATQRGIERLTSALLRHDVDATQCLVEVPWLGREHFFGLLDEMDIYLDMPAFSGYTTAWQAVHRGMPIVTLEGEFMRQRLAAGLLRKIEQTETIAQSEAEYIDIATRLAEECRDAELRAKRRAAIKAAAPKADHDVSVVRMFEQILLDELIQHHITLNPNKDEDMKKEKPQVINITKNLQQRYIELLKNTLLNEVYLENEVRFLYIFAMLSIGKNVDINTVREINKVLPEWVKSIREARQEGRPWWSLTLTDGKGGQKILNLRNVVEFSHTMVGRKRLDNIAHCLDIIRLENIPGDVIETGAWRGGASIFMKGYLSCYEMNDRKVWVADSFEGLPIPSLPEDAGYDFSASKQPILAVSLEEVQENFHRYDLLDENVKFLKGWFCDTLPTAPIEQLAVLRLDGDLYESTMDALNALYHKVVVGGFVIVDDYNDFEPCRRAITEFREKHKIIDPIQKIDWTGVFWRKS